jgi:hypothetical protein
MNEMLAGIPDAHGGTNRWNGYAKKGDLGLRRGYIVLLERRSGSSTLRIPSGRFVALAILDPLS